ncbi:MAG: hypothetical protein CMM61_08155 [Rhodospirillaceae bacterium]|nr:hypothetical protein [Rhodospirillaceae bacterium]
MDDIKTFPLAKPLKIGGGNVTALVLGPLDAGHAIDAAAAAERVVFGPSGEPVLVPSPVVATAERARRQVRKLTFEDGREMQGPMALADLRRLSEPALNALYDRLEKIDLLYLEREAGAGRFDGTDGGGNPVGGADPESGAGLPDGPGPVGEPAGN